MIFRSRGEVFFIVNYLLNSTLCRNPLEAGASMVGHRTQVQLLFTRVA